MKCIKFVVKVKRNGTHTTEYVQRIDRTPIQTTADRKLAHRPLKPAPPKNSNMP